MVTKKKYYKSQATFSCVFFAIALAFAAFLATPAPARAAGIAYLPAEQAENAENISLPQDEKATFVFRWLGIRFGKAFINWHEDDTSYRAEAHIKASGIAKLFTKQTRLIKVEGLKKTEEDGTTRYIPQKYSSNTTRKKKSRSIRIRYDAEGKVVESTVTPPDDRRWRPDVETEYKNAAIDYLTGALSFHFQARLPKKQARVLFYDGRRLTEGTFTHIGMSEHDPDALRRNTQAKKYIVRRVLKGGYTAKERRRYYQGEPGVMVIAMPQVSRLPHYVYADTDYGRVTAERK